MLTHMSKPQTLGGAVKAIREAKAEHDPRYKAAQFSIACLMSPGHLCNIEKGRKQPPLEVVERIADQLGVPVTAIAFIDNQGAAA